MSNGLRGRTAGTLKGGWRDRGDGAGRGTWAIGPALERRSQPLRDADALARVDQPLR